MTVCASLELPRHEQRPAQFQYRCWLCGAPALRVLCTAHTWAADDTDSTAPGGSTLDGFERRREHGGEQ